MKTIEKIAWSDTFSVGNKKLDDQHYMIISFINELIDMPNFKNQSEALKCITKMLDYSIEHLEYEEQILRDNDYPDSISHSIIHQFYVKKVNNYLKVSFMNNSNFKGEVLEFLKDWWTYHILEEDMKYRPFLESRGLV